MSLLTLFHGAIDFAEIFYQTLFSQLKWVFPILFDLAWSQRRNSFQTFTFFFNSNVHKILLYYSYWTVILLAQAVTGNGGPSEVVTKTTRGNFVRSLQVGPHAVLWTHVLLRLETCDSLGLEAFNYYSWYKLVWLAVIANFILIFAANFVKVSENLTKKSHSCFSYYLPATSRFNPLQENSCGCVRNIQSRCVLWLIIAVRGILERTFSLPPASKSSTFQSSTSDRRAATTAPADPAPTTNSRNSSVTCKNCDKIKNHVKLRSQHNIFIFRIFPLTDYKVVFIICKFQAMYHFCLKHQNAK